MRHREETLNTKLADVISEYGVLAEAEGILSHGRDRPDVLFDLFGLRVSIEGKLDDTPNAQSIVLQQAHQRFKVGISHISVAVVYPCSLRSISTSKLASILRKTNLDYSIVSEAGVTEWAQAHPEGLMDALRRSHQLLASKDTVQEAATLIQIGIERIACLWRGHPAICSRLASALGMSPASDKPDYMMKFYETASAVSALALANALIFQEQISRVNDKIPSIASLFQSNSPSLDVQNLWRMIWQTIDYDPIFRLAESISMEIPSSPDARTSLLALVEKVREVCEKQAAIHHDLMGRIYHYLLHDAKYLATYYTAPASATLLLKLALMPLRWKCDFGDIQSIRQLRIADLACGTGTLLMSASQAIADLFIRSRVDDKGSVDASDIASLHQAIVEDTLIGLDVLPTAVHLTASTLGLLAPDVKFSKMNLYALPLGTSRGKPLLGSLDLLGTSVIAPQLSLDGSTLEPLRVQTDEIKKTAIVLPKLDLCVMNPPFARSAGENLLFGSLPESERSILQKELSKRIKGRNANSTAGLGSPFCLLADDHLSKGGRLALILPHGATTGEAWQKTRNMIAQKYELEFVISNWSGESYSFSENTDLSEVMLVCRKLYDDEVPSRPTMYISLWKPLQNLYSAIALARQICLAAESNTNLDSTFSLRRASGEIEGIAFSACQPLLEENWSGALFAQASLYRTFSKLEKGEVQDCHSSYSSIIPLCRLSELGRLGPDCRDIHDAFHMKHRDGQVAWTPFAAFLDNNAKSVLSIFQHPNAFLTPRSKPAENRPTRNSTLLWQRSGDILLAERIRFNSHKIIAMLLDGEVLSNTLWPFRSSLSIEQKKALVLWLSSSLGLLLFFGKRVTTEGPWVKMKKPAWESMPVLDVRRLETRQLVEFGHEFDSVSTKHLKPLSQLAFDPFRISIDSTMTRLLGVPDLEPFRQLLGREPGLTGKSVSTNSCAITERELYLDGESRFKAAEI